MGECNGSIRGGGSRSSDCQNCSTLQFHLTISPSSDNIDDGERMTKTIDEVTKEDLSEDSNTLEVGTFELSSLYEAYDGATIKDEDYDLFSNNCADLPISILSSVGIDPTDNKIINFVATNLSAEKPSKFIMEELSQHDEGAKLIQAAENDKNIAIETFVSNYIYDRV